MKRSVYSRLMLVFLFVPQLSQLTTLLLIVPNDSVCAADSVATAANAAEALEYSVEERIYIVKQSLIKHQEHHVLQQPQRHTVDHQHQATNHHHQQQLQQHQHFHQEGLPNIYAAAPNGHGELEPTVSPPHLEHYQLHQLHHQHQRQPAWQQQWQQHPPQLRHQQQQLAIQHHQHHQLHQQQPQQNQQLFDAHQHQPLASSTQQVLLDTSRPYLYAHTQIEWKHESTHDGELNEFYMNNFESSEDQIAYYQIHHLQREHHHNPNLQQQYDQPKTHYHTLEQHLMYSRQTNDDHYHDMNNNRPAGSCDSHVNPSMLMQTNLEPICKTTSNLNNPNDAGSSGNVPNLSHLNNKPSRNSNLESYPLTTQQFHYDSSLMSAICHYWREMSGLCLISAIFLNWLVSVISRRFAASGPSRAEHAVEAIHRTTTNSRSTSKDTNNSNAQCDSAFEETASPISLDGDDDDDDMNISKSSSDDKDRSSVSAQAFNTSAITRQRSSTLRAEPIPIPASPGHNSLSTSVSNSLNTSEYNSRYSSDFDSIQRLGRGGFGIVFEARNKIDDCHYAVKRICLPLEKEARDRVMREVRALAKLDHAGIVRYYNAWLETPPDEWLKQHDAQLGIVHSKDGMSFFPSTDGVYERNESELITKGGGYGSGCKMMGESGDNSSGSFANGLYRCRPNGFRRFLKHNSSSPSLDIVFEGSGSIRLEAENNTEKTNSSKEEEKGPGRKHFRIRNVKNNGDNNSDSEEGSDFIQFESKSNDISANDEINSLVDLSIPSHLTEPFSSDDDNLDELNIDEDKNNIEKQNQHQQTDAESKKALNYQKELRHLNNSMIDNSLHVEKVYLYIQMQLCRKDTLKDWLKTNCEHRDKTTMFDLFYQIVDAVEYVHSQDLIHRDLKPSNIFFSLDGTLKIGDFGLCRAKTSVGIGSSLDLQEYVAESDVERGFEAVHTEQVGTQLYMSPEQLSGLSYNQKVDIFAMGLILLELLIPFKTQMQRVHVLFKARNNLYSDEFRNEFSQEHKLVKTLLSRSPQKRPTATEIKQHELLASAQLSQPVIERIFHRRRTISSNSSTE